MVHEQHGVLERYGWGSFFARQQGERRAEARRTTQEPVVAGRLVFASRGISRVVTEGGELICRSAGKLRSDSPGGEPAIGDWVMVEPLTAGDGRIVAVFDRRTVISRKVAGEETREQVVAANLDSVFIVMGLDGDFNLRRLERFAVMARESGAEPVVVLTKRDLTASADEMRLDAMEVVAGVPVLVTSAAQGEGLEPLALYLEPGRTVVLIGSSGAGKSTLINRLAGAEIMRTGAVRSGDDRGRHTTTHRQLLTLPSGALVIDNPGVREVQLWAAAESVGEAFGEIEALAGECRFRDCDHQGEPGCAVRAAVESGQVEGSRFNSYLSLRREQRFLELKQNDAARRRAERQQGAFYREVKKQKRKGR